MTSRLLVSAIVVDSQVARANPRALVADGDAQLRAAIAETLRPWAIEVVVASSAPATLAEAIGGPITPPGCASPNCTQTNLSDPTACKRCTKTTACSGGACGGDTCVLCAGQNSSDLPASCNGTNACPSGQPTCPTGTGCPDQTYCETGCCIAVIQ